MCVIKPTQCFLRRLGLRWLANYLAGIGLLCLVVYFGPDALPPLLCIVDLMIVVIKCLTRHFTFSSSFMGLLFLRRTKLSTAVVTGCVLLQSLP